MVGTCASSPAPTISPMGPPPLRCHDGVLQVAVEVESQVAPFAADARPAGAAERRLEVADEEAVDPDGARDEPFGDAGRAVAVAGGDGGGQAEAGVVGEPDGLVLVGEGLQGQ